MVTLTDIELAMVERLRKGLGKLVTTVETYGGELDDEGLYQVVQQMPACWVTFAGITKDDWTSTSQRKSQPEARFVVMVAARSFRSEAASRHGGVSQWEVGANQLVWAVRRLLIGQDLGLAIDAFKGVNVKTLFKTSLERQQAMAVYAVEFSTFWVEKHLECGQFPSMPMKTITEHGQTVTVPDTDHPDYLFYQYEGQQSAAPDLLGMNMEVKQTQKTEADLTAEVKTKD